MHAAYFYTDVSQAIEALNTNAEPKAVEVELRELEGKEWGVARLEVDENDRHVSLSNDSPAKGWQTRKTLPTAQRDSTPATINTNFVPRPLIHDQHQHKWGWYLEIPAERCYET